MKKEKKRGGLQTRVRVRKLGTLQEEKREVVETTMGVLYGCLGVPKLSLKERKKQRQRLGVSEVGQKCGGEGGKKMKCKKGWDEGKTKSVDAFWSSCPWRRMKG